MKKSHFWHLRLQEGGDNSSLAMWWEGLDVSFANGAGLVPPGNTVACFLRNPVLRINVTWVR